jgi:Caspase domain
MSVLRMPVLVRIMLAVLATLFGTGTGVAQTAEAPLPTRVGDAFYPAYARLILQSQNPGGSAADAVAWTWDDKFVVAVHALDQKVFVWEVATGRLINKIDFPPFADDEYFEPSKVAVEVDKNARMTVRGRLVSADDEKFCRYVELRYPLGKAGIWNRSTPFEDKVACAPGGAADAVTKSDDGGRTYAHNGLMTLVNGTDTRDPALRVLDANDRVIRRLQKPPPLAFTHAALSPDGRTMALIVDARRFREDGSYIIDIDEGLRAQPASTRVLLFEIPTSTQPKPITVPGAYARVTWLDDKRILLARNDLAIAIGDSKFLPEPHPPTPARIVDVATGQEIAPPVPERCFVVPLKGDVLIGAGLGNCSTDTAAARGLMRYDPGSGWRTLDEASFKGAVISHIAPSPDGSRIAVFYAGAAPAKTYVLRLYDAASGATIAQTPMPDYSYAALTYAPDGRSVIATLNGRHFNWEPGKPPVEVGPNTPPALPFTQPAVAADGLSWHEYSSSFDTVSLIDVSPGRPAAAPRVTRTLDGVVAAGLMPGNNVYWAVTRNDGIRFWPSSFQSTRSTFDMISTWLIPGGHYFTLTPDRRYDTDLGADSDQFRWIVTDTAFESLGPQTFMRDYFEPRLGGRALACTEAGTCDQMFERVPSPVQLNRALPTVEIARVAPGPKPDTAWVEIVARPGSKPEARFGKTASAIYDLRLFRDGNLVARLPGVADRAGLSLDDWRAANLVQTGPDGVARFRRVVALPTGADVKTVRFSAYAFNEDRIKSETAALTYDRPATVPRGRRAFVLTIGIDAYDDPRLKLRFAARDADLIATRLAAIPGFDESNVRRAALTAPANAKRAISRETIAAALGILAGSPRGPLLDRLAKAGFDASALDAASPDDIVIIAYAGHGWADKTGNFFLILSNAKAIDPLKPPDTSGFVSAIDLGNWLRGVDAGEIAFIIDACNSAASVDAGGFKPGPMGDANLGQLAFDKGIRILAATQNADVALEDDKLGHGLLTWALAGEGIDAGGFGRADRDKDGAITLDEWLRYATERLPALSEDVRLKRYSALGSRDFDLVPLVPVDKPKPQEPALFDFTGRPSSTVLRKRTP